jgi:TATA-box binding protein (TBP) (component of TFIID and TFIIIB)
MTEDFIIEESSTFLTNIGNELTNGIETGMETGVMDVNIYEALEAYIESAKNNEKSLNPVTVNYSCYSLSNIGYKLRNICDAFKSSKFTPNKFPTAVSRIDECTLLSYPKRRTKVVGIKCVNKVLFYLHAFRLLLGCTSIALHYSLKFGKINVMNIVAMAVIDRKYINNDNMARIFNYRTSYVPELFPCLIFYHQDFTVNVFDTGKILISGLKSNEDKRKAVCVIFYHIWKSITDKNDAEEFKMLYIENPNPPDVTLPIETHIPEKSFEEEEDKENLRFYTSDPSNERSKRLFSTSLYKHPKSKFSDRINKRHAKKVDEDCTLFTVIHNMLVDKHALHIRYKNLNLK